MNQPDDKPRVTWRYRVEVRGALQHIEVDPRHEREDGTVTAAAVVRMGGRAMSLAAAYSLRESLSEAIRIAENEKVIEP